MELLLGLDIGTSNMKAILLSLKGEKIALGKRKVQFLYPKSGYVEICPEYYYQSACDLIKEMTLKAPSGSRIIAICIAVASGSIILLDEKGKALTNIISCFLDKRTEKKSHEVLPGFDFANVHTIVGWPWLEVCPLAHLAWLKKNSPDIFQKSAHYCMNNDYLLYRLTGKYGIDHSTATTFYLQDQVGRCWHKPYLKILNISESALSELFPSGTVLGPLTRKAAEDTSLSRDTLVVLGSFDHPAAARGTGIFTPGDILLSCGSSWVAFYPVENRDFAINQGLVVDPFLTPKGPWGMMFSLPWIGLNVEWYIDNLILRPREDPAQKYNIFNHLAQKARVKKKDLFINPFIDIKNSPRIINEIKSSYSRDEISLSVMEGVAFEMKKTIRKLSRVGALSERITMVGGPSESSIWPNIVAEVTNLEIIIINGESAGAVGAAILAGVGAGIFHDEFEAYSIIRSDSVKVKPDKDGIKKYNFMYKEYLGKT